MYFCTIAVTESVHYNIAAVTECISTQKRRLNVLQYNSGDRVYFNAAVVTECTSIEKQPQSVYISTEERR